MRSQRDLPAAQLLHAALGMTWVIAGSSIFGTGALVSDTRVQFSDGATAELLQKAYPVGNYIAAGFAGSVRIGFDLIESLTNFMAVPVGTGAHAWNPRGVASDWALTAKQIFDSAPPEEQRLQSQLLLLGASPVEHMGAPEFRRIDIARFASPDFTPRFAKRGALTVFHIGSGAGVREYVRGTKPLFRLGSGIHKAHMAGIDEWARTLAFSMTIAIRDHPNNGISQHFHVVAVRLGRIVMGTNDMTTHLNDGPPVELKMPPVARSWQEFMSLANEQRANASGAIC